MPGWIAVGRCLSPSRPWKGGIGLHGDDLDGGVVFAQGARDAGERAGGAQTGDEVGHLAAGLLDDLWAGGGVVGLPVRRVVVLVGVEIAIGLLSGRARGRPGWRHRSLRAGR